MREILHFKSEKEKIAYLKGEFHEVLPIEVEAEEPAVEEPAEGPEEEEEAGEEGTGDEVQAE